MNPGRRYPLQAFDYYAANTMVPRFRFREVVRPQVDRSVSLTWYFSVRGHCLNEMVSSGEHISIARSLLRVSGAGCVWLLCSWDSRAIGLAVTCGLWDTCRLCRLLMALSLFYYGLIQALNVIVSGLNYRHTLELSTVIWYFRRIRRVSLVMVLIA